MTFLIFLGMKRLKIKYRYATSKLDFCALEYEYAKKGFDDMPTRYITRFKRDFLDFFNKHRGLWKVF